MYFWFMKENEQVYKTWVFVETVRSILMYIEIAALVHRCLVYGQREPLNYKEFVF